MPVNSERHVWIYDIETAINERAKEYLATADLGYDSRLKDEAKIAANKIERREEALKKAALYWWYGQIVSISCLDTETGIPYVWTGRHEHDNIDKFFFCLRELNNNKDTLLVGKSSSQFDDGYLIGRCIALDIGVPSFLRNQYGLITDIDHIFSKRQGAASVGKLSDYAFGIGMQKLANGADVAAMVAEEDWTRLAQYNMEDVKITHEIYRRYNKECIYG